MNDLVIWRHLQAGTISVDEVVAIARLPLARRGPYLGALVELAGTSDPKMRIAVMRALAGVRGVPGLRAVVGGLDDRDEEVRLAAVHALRECAVAAPFRYTHALFHPRPDVRLAALRHPEIPQHADSLGVYLRADPVCAEAAKKMPWSMASPSIAVELYALGCVEPAELVKLVWELSAGSLRGFLASERLRSLDVTDTYLDRGAIERAGERDHFDPLIDAFLKTPGWDAAGGSLERLVKLLANKRNRLLARRCTVSLLDWLARQTEATAAQRHGVLVVAFAFEPRLIGASWLRAIDIAAAVFALVHHDWPIKPSTDQVVRLMELPIARSDLALMAAIAGLLQAQRAKTLVELFGEEALVAALVARDRGWAELCALPGETPARELEWLKRVELRDYKRYIALAAVAVTIFTGKRLEAFVEEIPRRHRLGVFLAGMRAKAETDPERLAAVCMAAAKWLDRAGVTGLIEALLRDEPAARRTLLLALVRETTNNQLTAAILPLTDDHAALFVEAIDDPINPPPRSCEIAIAGAFRTRLAAPVKAWIAKTTTSFDTPSFLVDPPLLRRALTSEERGRIMSASTSELARAMAPALEVPVHELASALAVVKAYPNATVCAALFACTDPFPDVARQCDRFSEPTPAFARALDHEIQRWQRFRGLAPLANAALYRWEASLNELREWIEKKGGPLLVLRELEQFGDGLSARTLWQGVSEAVMFDRYRHTALFESYATVELAHFCAERVDRSIGRHAARIVVALVEGRAVDVGEVRDRVLERIADADAATREYAGRLIRIDGMPSPPPGPRLAASSDLVDTIRKTEDLDALVGWCGHANPVLVEEAVLALLVLGTKGQLQLAAILEVLHTLPHPLAIISSIILWDEPEALARARDLGLRSDAPPAWRFYANVSLAMRGEAGAAARAIAAARQPDPSWYFKRTDWELLLRVAEPYACAISLADASHHHAYNPALTLLLATVDTSEPTADAFVRFLELDPDRPMHLRHGAAARLAAIGDWRGLPLIVDAAMDARTADWLLVADMLEAVEAVVAGTLVGGSDVASEKRMMEVFDRWRRLGKDPAATRALAGRILEEASSPAARRIAATIAVSHATGHERLERVAEVFAWGVKRGAELTGRMLHFHLTTKESDLGYTRLRTSSIFVSPLPMLRNETHGRDIVEGLVLHEIGHHVYHRGEEPEAIWARAHEEGLGHLLNLVADEHLERNLRAVDASYGDRLKRLGAYAFQHSAHEIAVPRLVDSLRAATATALIKTPLEVAFAENAVRIRRGQVLAELDRAGHPLARFARAFRLGHGNRSGDPMLAKALALTNGIRDMTMAQMYELTKQLAELFGGTTEVAKVFGGPEGLEAGDHTRDDDVFGAGVNDEDLQREIERILDPRKRGPRKAGPRGNKLQINVSPDLEFDPITTIEKVTANAEAHRDLVRDIARHADRLRSYLADLGLQWIPQRARTQGRALDRTRLLPLVTRNDPRILVARTPKRRNDFFLGVIVDCSGSMTSRDNLGRAKRFAALVAEAVEPLAGVDARFFGFTDSVIYDAGNAHDCGVAGLESSGGNNDAAALYHVANVALESKRRAKVVVMISDGLPTECSVDALRALVQTLTRKRGIVCAQVAVNALEEVCFPHYVVLDGAIEAAVARFGRMIADLARRALGA